MESPGTSKKMQQPSAGKAMNGSMQKSPERMVNTNNNYSVSFKNDPAMHYASGAAGPGTVGGTGEELAQTLEKVVSQLDIISRTLNVLEQRVSMNEESVAHCLDYFKEVKQQKVEDDK